MKEKEPDKKPRNGMDLFQSIAKDFRKYKEENGLKYGSDDTEYAENDDLDLEDDMAITTAVWRNTHIPDVSCPSDSFYARAADNLRTSILNKYDLSKLSDDFPKDLAIALVSYVEDIKSELGAWDAFRNLYKAKYGHWLPFYDTDHDDYFTDDLNVEDIKFIIWQTMCRDQRYEGYIYSPYSEIQEKLGPIILDWLVPIFDEAPAATPMKTAIQRSLRTDNYAIIRSIAYWLAIRCPFISDSGMEQEVLEDSDDLEEKLIEKDVPHPSDFSLYVTMAEAAWKDESGPLGIPSAAMTAQMARDYGFPKTAKHLDGFLKAKAETFFINKTDREFLYTDDNAGVEYKIRKDSFVKGTAFHGMTEVNAMLVKYDDAWNVNGICIPAFEPTDRDSATHLVAGHPSMMIDIDEIIERNGGKQIFYCKNKKEVEKIIGIKTQNHPKLDKIKKNAVVMLSREKGFNILPDLAGCFTDPENKFYDKKNSEDLSLELIMECRIPDDIAKYIVDRNLLADASVYASQGKEVGHELVQKNLEFLFGFYRSY